MKLSPNTLNILKNFATIQPNLVVNPGSVIKTIAESKSILAEAQVTETFDKTFGLYDLNEFLNVYTLLEDPEVEFNDDHLKLESGNCVLTYRFSEIGNLTTPTKSIQLNEGDVTLSLTENQIAAIRSAASVLGHAIVGFVGDGNQIKVAVHDPIGGNGNALEIDLGIKTNHTFHLNFQTAEIKVLSGDYDVILSKKLISKWVNKSDAVTYYIALDANHSSFNG